MRIWSQSSKHTPTLTTLPSPAFVPSCHFLRSIPRVLSPHLLTPRLRKASSYLRSIQETGPVYGTTGYYRHIRSFSSVSALAADLRGRAGSAGAERGQDDDACPTPPAENIKDSEAWISLLEKHVPHGGHRYEKGAGNEAQRDACDVLLKILRSASSKQHAHVDLLSLMGFRSGDWQQVYEIATMLLETAASDVAESERKNVSNGFQWPIKPSLDELCMSSVVLEAASDSRTSQRREVSLASALAESGTTETALKRQDQAMMQIWKSLAYIVIETTKRSETEAQAPMQFVYRVIAQIHRLGLVPGDVYSYSPSPHSLAVNRPPIVHLLSSRIMTTLSDATWRAHQDAVIAEAAKSGTSLKDLAQDPPGGRFRLKVRPLGPEVWLEFVLWCCVEGGYASTGAAIVERLRELSDEPWFAINWIRPNELDGTPAGVNWAKVKLRHGGTVGQIEGYASTEPFAVMASRTISAEVVLALVDLLSKSVNLGINKPGIGLRRVQKSIRDLIVFLEPHCLPAGYFDYLAVGMLQSGGFDPDRNPDGYRGWAHKLTEMRSLEALHHTNLKGPPSKCLPFDLESVLTQCETLNGLFHQTLCAFVDRGDVRPALDVFAQIQQLVDQSKLESIGAFLGGSQQMAGFFSSRTASTDPDFVNSHGQLPMYRLAAMLDMVTDSKLIGLGNWLVDSDDVDGPLIPRNTYGRSSLAPVVTRFAAISHDTQLRKEVQDACLDLTVINSVAMLRAMTSSRFHESDIYSASFLLRKLATAKGGGVDAGTLASIAAAILEMEGHVVGMNASTTRITLLTTSGIFERMLQGCYQENSGWLRKDQRALLRRQTSAILMVLEHIPNTSLKAIAGNGLAKLGPAHDISLQVGAFNVIMSAVVETKGAQVGQMIWELVCEDPRHKLEPSQAYKLSNYVVSEVTQDEDGRWDMAHNLRTAEQRLPDMYGYLPIAEANEAPIDGADHIIEPDPFVESTKPDLTEATSDQDFAPPAEGIDFEFHRGPPTASAFEYNQPADVESGPDWGAGPLGNRTISDPKQRLGTTTASTAGDSPSFPIHHDISTATPLVHPNLQTLRLIVRGALTERRARQSTGDPTHIQQAILDWSVQFYRAFGVRGLTIQQEVQTPVEVEPRPSLLEEKRLYDKSRAAMRAQKVPVSPPRVRGDVQKLFTGGLVTKYPAGRLVRKTSFMAGDDDTARSDR